MCFDATRFGSGLQEAVRFAAEKNFSACEFSFSRFDVTEKGAKQLNAAEKEYLLEVNQLCKQDQVEISCLRLNTVLKASDKKSASEFKSLIDKLSKVAAALTCKKLLFYLEAEGHKEWLKQTESILAPLAKSLQKKDISLVLSLSTPASFRGRSLSGWRPVEPGEWRELLAGIPELSLSFSVADCAWQGIDYLKILPGIVQGLSHVEAQDVQVNRQIISENGLFGPLWWRYMTVGKGQVDWGQFVEALKLYDYSGDLSIHFNDEFASENEQGLWEALETSLKVLAPLVKY